MKYKKHQNFNDNKQSVLSYPSKFAISVPTSLMLRHVYIILQKLNNSACISVSL